MKGISNDPQSPIAKYIKLSAEYQYTSYAQAVQWLTAQIGLKYCGYCLGNDDKEAGRNMAAEAEENLRKLRAPTGSGPVIFGGAGKSGPDVTIAILNAELQAYHYNGSGQNQSVNSSGAIVNSNTEKKKKLEEEKQTEEERKKVEEEYNKLNAKNEKDIKSIAEEANKIVIKSTGAGRKTKIDEADDLFKNSEDGRVKEKKGNLDPKIVALKQEASDAKLSSYSRTASLVASSDHRNCSLKGLIVDLSHSGYSREKSAHSINSSQPWSNWVKIPGTVLQVRFSKKKVCEEPEFPNTTDFNENLKYVMEGSDQFFDYGFIQFQSTSNAIISGTFVLTAKGDKDTHQEDWPIFFEASGVQEESLGNWYMGCELLSLEIKEYCVKGKSK